MGDPANWPGYALESFKGTLHQGPHWATFSLPGPGWLGVHLFKQGARAGGRNLALRADWYPA